MSLRAIVFVSSAFVSCASSVATSNDELCDDIVALVDDAADELADLGLELDRDAVNVLVKDAESSRDDFRDTFSLLLPSDFFETWISVLDGVGALHGDRVSPNELREAGITSLLSAVQAYYVTGRGEFVALDTVTGRVGRALSGLEAVARHELVHAWQDQQGVFDALLGPARDSVESARIANCLTEGHAELVALALAAGRDRLDEIDTADLESTLERASAGDALEVYRAGLAYMLARHHDGGFAAVRGALVVPPTSTEQILHPEKDGRDLPTRVELPELGGRRVHEDTLGEMQIGFLLATMGVGAHDVGLAVTGWDGDRLAVVEDDDGDRVVVWRSVWDRPIDAEQFAAHLRDACGVVRVRGRVVDWVGRGKSRDALLARLDAEPPVLLDVEAADAASTEAAESVWNQRLADVPAEVDGRWIHPLGGLSLLVPAHYEVAERRGMSLLVDSLEDDDPFTSNVRVQVSPAPRGVGVDEWIDVRARQIEAIPGLDLVLQRKVRISDRDAVLSEMTSSAALSGGPLHLAELAYLRKGKQVIVTATTTEQGWQDHADLFFEILLGAEIDDVR